MTIVGVLGAIAFCTGWCFLAWGARLAETATQRVADLTAGGAMVCLGAWAMTLAVAS